MPQGVSKGRAAWKAGAALFFFGFPVYNEYEQVSSLRKER
jgi:hypothetical protein